MQPRHRRAPLPRRGGPAALLAGLLGIVLGGCGVLELGDAPHDAVVLQTAEPSTDQGWSVVVELLRTEIDGEAVVAVAFAGDEVACVDGGTIAADELQPATELRFGQGRDGVEHSTDEDVPPVVSSVELEVHCD